MKGKVFKVLSHARCLVTIGLTKELSLRDFTNICELWKTLQEPSTIVTAFQWTNMQPWLTRSDSRDRWIEPRRRSEEIEFQQQRRIIQKEFLLLKQRNIEMSRSEIYSAGFANQVF